ncbi:phosphoenolpyruvate carboxylase [Halopenitus persicus]|uniref:phosphoenolpyruvate carboxylase n=1 Tax=Halopenitus persicus TaxID=1048396 RepID=A0A1H3G4B8_9EURY|nr:phosphoenolpyruvate carboxylase [Halopenitus persicus]SDX97219.1 Phosphoenolpyruvate carboxylase, type 1 [Halopenitus persicus]
MDLYRRDIRRDVRDLGALVGDVLTEQASADAFETVEALRTDAIAYRSSEDALDSRDPLRSTLAASGADGQLVVARAFTAYFELINLAEERERVRALREQSQADVPDDGLAEAIALLREADPEVAERVLSDVLVEPTFTAHPTEARRKTVKTKLRSVAGTLAELDERLLTDDERDRLERELRADVTSLWQTPQVRDRRPEPIDEVSNVQWYLENVLFDVVGDVLEPVAAFADDGPAGPTLLEFRSWAGSDRDGNPHVTPAVTAETLERQREAALEGYRDRVRSLSNVLSQDASRLELGDDVRESLARDKDQLPDVAERAESRYPNEPYRQKLLCIHERLDRVGDVRPGGYADADAFRRDLEALAADLRANDASDVAATHVDPLVRTVATFGFTLASLDLRDHQENHTQAVTEALDRAGIDYAAMDESERVRFLTAAMDDAPDLVAFDALADGSDTTARVLERFAKLADWQREYGADAIDTYCISMCEEPSHVLEVLFLAAAAGVVDLPEHSGLDVVPLLETEYALSDARRIMGTLFENEAYAAAVAARGDVQEVMLGYSDSNKENGYLAAQWALYSNQRRLSTIAEEHGVELRLFHGRGGSISRSGGPVAESLLSLPPETVTGAVKYTEQGEAIAERYANPRIATRELERLLNAQIRARLRALQGEADPVEPEWEAAMETAADAAREAYRELLATDGFLEYFGDATPISVIEELNLGSRPASRSGERTVEDLRAIPWVFAWTQTRCPITGWYSLATGLDAYLESGGDVETLAAMYESWPFFRTILDSAALSLARTDLEIAAEYAALADPDVRDRVFGRIREEHDRAVELVRAITGRETLVKRGWLTESLERRNPYVDPLNLLQVRLLDRDSRSAMEDRALRLTVKGIAAGMKTTG